MQSVLIISNYFPPETGAAANRIDTLSRGLDELGWDVSVLCPLPNYPKGKIFDEYRKKIKHTSKENTITVHRIWIFPSNSKNKLLRLIAMLSFSFSVSVFLLFYKTPKKVIIQSPPLFVAFFSTLICKLKRKKIVLNVSDLWPLAGKELGVMKENFSYKMLEKIESYNYKNAHLIMGQSEEICTYVNTITPTKTLVYRNYPKFSVTESLNTKNSDKINIVYAGLLGVAQGIFSLCEHIILPDNVVLNIYGDGAEKAEISKYIDENPDRNIIYHGEISRSELHKILSENTDYAIAPLTNRIYGSVPSKIFEMAAIGIPIIYMGGGEGEELVKRYELGAVITPYDYHSLNGLVASLTKTDSFTKERIKAISKSEFSFDVQMKAVNEVLKAL